MLRQMSYGIVLLFLAMLTPGDLREKKIPVNTTLFFAVPGAIYRLLISSFSGREVLECLIPGGILILFAVLTKESIGFGDGFVVFVMGLWTEGWFTTIAVCISIFCSGICGFIFWVMRKEDQIPFVPFLLIGMEVSLLYA